MTMMRISKRNLVAATICYLVVALLAIWLVALVTAHCPEPRCTARSDTLSRWGWGGAALLYPGFLWITRRSIRRRH